ncbi:AMP-binding protein [Actinoplanes flavus]|uniref:AMP-binding protein n=1 Tax=Actinoplanes flavus TaxID=2820290 RepID=A0ABS3UWR5_9ACTN|nr:AMP-binding protein [Actinoplanes flavus]MBO3742992.1 AMP-binding protein [Actinoplanes flavus]
MRTAWESIVVPAGLARRYREQGWWRDATFSDDLRESAAEAPDETALLTWRERENRLIALSFREFDVRADAVAGALQRLGVGRGDVVAYQLPAWWETAVLMIACQRVGAIVAPLHTLFGSFETERVLAATDAVACVVADEYNGVEQARLLLEQAPRLPSLRHRIVIGDAAATNAVSLDDAFHGRHSTVERPSDLVPFEADEVCALLMTSGTTGETQLVAHSPNTLYAVPRQAPAPGQLRAITSGMSFASGFRRALHATWRGVPTLFSDSRAPETWLDLIEKAKVTELWTSPRMLRDLVEEQRRRARDVSGLESIGSFGGPLPQVTLSDVRESLCPVVRNVWGMTECGPLLCTAAEDPPEHAGRSLGRPRHGGEVRLEPAGQAHHHSDVFHLHVRGPAVCLATVGRDSGQVRWSPDADGGWLDTGDLVAPDGTGGLRFVGRAAERIGDAWQIPVADVENALLTHPDIDDAVLLPWPHADGRETPCVAVISATRLELRDVRDHLGRLGFRELCLPTRIEHVTEFPRAGLGKVRRKILLDRLRERAAVPAG